MFVIVILGMSLLTHIGPFGPAPVFPAPYSDYPAAELPKLAAFNAFLDESAGQFRKISSVSSDTMGRAISRDLWSQRLPRLSDSVIVYLDRTDTLVQSHIQMCGELSDHYFAKSFRSIDDTTPDFTHVMDVAKLSHLKLRTLLDDKKYAEAETLIRFVLDYGVKLENSQGYLIANLVVFLFKSVACEMVQEYLTRTDGIHRVNFEPLKNCILKARDNDTALANAYTYEYQSLNGIIDMLDDGYSIEILYSFKDNRPKAALSETVLKTLFFNKQKAQALNYHYHMNMLDFCRTPYYSVKSKIDLLRQRHEGFIPKVMEYPTNLYGGMIFEARPRLMSTFRKRADRINALNVAYIACAIRQHGRLPASLTELNLRRDIITDQFTGEIFKYSPTERTITYACEMKEPRVFHL